LAENTEKLWDSEEEDSEKAEIDLSAPSENIYSKSENDEERNVPPVKNEINKAVVAASVVVMILLATSFWLLISGNSTEILVPSERYGDSIGYDVSGDLRVESEQTTIPINLVGTDIEVKRINLSYAGIMDTATKQQASTVKDGYGESQGVFVREAQLDLSHVQGEFVSENDETLQISGGKVYVKQKEYVTVQNGETIKSESESNLSIISGVWGSQKLVSWVPRTSNHGLLPHTNLYEGKNLIVGTSGTDISNGFDLKWSVLEGKKIEGYETVKLRIQTYCYGNQYCESEIGLLDYNYSYVLDLYISEESFLPLKFDYAVTFFVSVSNQKIFDVEFNYGGTVIEGGAFFSKGNEVVPKPTGDGISGPNDQGEFKSWNGRAPDFGNRPTSLDENWTVQDAIQIAEDNDVEFGNYLQQYENAYVTNAVYTNQTEEWNVTFGYSSEGEGVTDRYNIRANKSGLISSNATQSENPIVMEPCLNGESESTECTLSNPLTVSSAEEIFSSWEEVASWASYDGLVGNEINHNRLTLTIGQSAMAPTVGLDFDTLDIGTLILDLWNGNFNLAEYQKTIEPNGGYGYYLERETDNSMIGTAIDGNDGLLLFVIEVHNSND
tara:strand:- start:14969 stop:16801 length:1833 start_codon:yes stop_codon:yes gene_type:complete